MADGGFIDVKNTKGVFNPMGASNHSKEGRAENDYYATEPKATRLLMDIEKFAPNIWECACGGGHMAEVIKQYGYNVRSSDLVDRGYGDVFDFLHSNIDDVHSFKFDGDIITNPPYKCALEFCQRALDYVEDGHKIAMFLRLLFLEGKKRKEFFLENPPKTVYVSSSRLRCLKNGEEEAPNAVAFAWFVWEKGFKGDTIIKWIN